MSVIVPAYDPGPELDRCLEALFHQDVPPGDVEIVVVDNGSSPPIDDRWGGRVRLVVEPNPGSYAARNAGVRAASASRLAFTDSDCVPDSGWLRAGLAALDRGAAVVTGPVVLFGGQPVTVTELYEFRYGFPQDRYLEEGFGVTANLFVERQAIEGGGLFDRDLRSGGDREFGQRLARHGWPTEWAEHAVVRHPARRHVRELLRKARRTGAGAVLLQRRSTPTVRLAIQSLWLFRPPVKALVKIVREERSVSLRQRLALTGLVLIVRATVAFTRLRSLMGKEAPR